MSNAILVEQSNGIGKVVLNRPDVKNAFDWPMVNQLADELTILGRDDSIAGVILSGMGSAFCAGGDLNWARNHAGGLASAFNELASRFHNAIVVLRQMRKPVVAAINGVAAGAGFSLALACDFRVMSKQAVFRHGYGSVGLCMDGGASFTLTRLIGPTKALEVAALDETISADRALQWGLVTLVAEAEDVLAEAVNLTNRVTARSRNSFAWSKSLINDSYEGSLECRLDRERKAIVACAEHPDGIEGIAAFAEKRQPVFREQ